MDAFKTETLDTSDMPDIPPGYSIRVEYFSEDYPMGYPWDEHDGHGVIRTAYASYARPEKAPGEVIIHEERGTYWIYHVQETMAIALRDGWGLGDTETEALRQKLGRAPTKREIAAESVQQDIRYCRRWLTGDIFWCFVTAAVLDPEGQEVGSDSIGGIEFEWGSDYAEETAHDVAANVLHAVGLTLRQRRETWRAALRETRERRYWAARDVVTV